MTRWPKLAKPPIREAVIDIQVRPSPEFDLRNFPDEIAGYETRTEVFGHHVDIKESEGSLTTTDNSEHIGFKYQPPDRSAVVQFRKDRFTYSIIEGYESWPVIKQLAQEYWSCFLKASQPKRVARVATRYINILNLPPPFSSFSEHLTSPPPVPSGLPNLLSSFLTRVVLHEPREELVLILTQALKQAKEDAVPITLDIDVFSEIDLSPTSDQIWSILDKCRNFKNRAFFESLTEKTLELYK